MNIKPIQPQQVSNCRFCKAEGKKTASKWHLTFENIQACDEHKFKLEEIKKESDEQSKHLSEADYQTWMRL